MYANDWDGYLPGGFTGGSPPYRWVFDILDYFPGGQAGYYSGTGSGWKALDGLRCPSFRILYPTNWNIMYAYAFNATYNNATFTKKITAIKYPSRMFLLCDGYTVWIQAGNFDADAAFIHPAKPNILYADAHVGQLGRGLLASATENNIFFYGTENP